MSGDVLFVKTSSLGDVIHNMPALSEARVRSPGRRLAWVVEEAFAPLVRLHPAVDDVVAVASRRWRRMFPGPTLWHEVTEFRRNLRGRSYDVVIDTQGLLRSALIARTAHGCSHGYDFGSVRERWASPLYDVRHRVARGQHAIARNRALTGLALGYQPEGPPDFGLDRHTLAPAAQDRYAVLLHATAQRNKEWPVEHWITLGRSLAARDLRVMLPWGNHRERLRSQVIAEAVPNAVVPERQPLDLLARHLAGASLVIGVDTGLMHLAGALGVPLVSIFTGSDPGLTRPMGTGRIAVLGERGLPPLVGAVADAAAAVLPD